VALRTAANAWITRKTTNGSMIHRYQCRSNTHAHACMGGFDPCVTAAYHDDFYLKRHSFSSCVDAKLRIADDYAIRSDRARDVAEGDVPRGTLLLSEFLRYVVRNSGNPESAAIVPRGTWRTTIRGMAVVVDRSARQ
jgi:hypothetical protein